jgi:hypothetical protein
MLCDSDSAKFQLVYLRRTYYFNQLLSYFLLFLMSSIYPYGQSQGSDIFFSPNRGLGFNRRTWNAGQTVGRAIKRWWNTPSATRQAKKASHARSKAKKTKRSSSSGVSRLPAINDGVGGQHSRFSWKSKTDALTPQLKAMLPPSIYVENGGAQKLCTESRQVAFQLLNLFSPTDINNLLSKYGTQGTQVAGTGVNRIYLDKVYASVKLANIYLTNCEVILYDCVARKDLPDASITANTDTSWSQGLLDEASGANAVLVPGGIPFDSQIFNTYWKVMNTTRMTIAAGAIHTHVIEFAPHCMMGSEYATRTAGGYQDLTYSCLMVLKGQPVNDNTTKTTVTYSVAGVNIIDEVSYHFRFPANNTTQWYKADNLLGVTTAAENFISVGGSTVQNANVEA